MNQVLTTQVTIAKAKADGAGYALKATSTDDYISKLQHPLTVEGYFNRFGDPFVLRLAFDKALGYNYGYFHNGTNFYYFAVDRIEPLNEQKCRLHYTIDWFMTCFSSLNMPSAYIHRLTSSPYFSFPQKKRDFWPFERSIPHTLAAVKVFQGFDIIVYSVTNQAQRKIFICRSTGQHNYLSDFVKGNFQMWLVTKKLIATIAEIKGLYLLPSGLVNLQGWGKVEGEDIYTFRPGFAPDPQYTFNVRISAQPGRLTVFKDHHDNVIWTAPVNDPCYQDFYKICPITTYFDCSSSSCSVKFFVEFSPSMVEKFELFADNLEIFTSAYLEYDVRQREYDLEMRKIAQEKGLVGGFASSGNQAIGGAIAGGPIGAVAGFALGAIGSVGNYFIEGHYGPREQQATDALYRRQLPDKVTAGSSPWYMYANFCGFYYFYWESADYTWQDRNGFIIERYQPDFNKTIADIMKTPGETYIKADVDIVSSQPNDIKNNIKYRFTNGIRFV